MKLICSALCLSHELFDYKEHIAIIKNSNFAKKWQILFFFFRENGKGVPVSREICQKIKFLYFQRGDQGQNFVSTTFLYLDNSIWTN